MMGVASLFGSAMALAKGNWLFPLVVAWAVRGIGVRYADLPALASTARWLVPVGIIVGIAARLIGRSQRAAGRANPGART